MPSGFLLFMNALDFAEHLRYFSGMICGTISAKEDLSMKYTTVNVQQLTNRKGKPWQARAKYKDVYGRWKEVSKMLPEHIMGIRKESPCPSLL